MTPDDPASRFKQVNRQMIRHRFWNAATRDAYGQPWAAGVVDRLVILANGEPVDYLETIADMEDDEHPVEVHAFTATRRLLVTGNYRGRLPGPEAEVSVKARAGLVKVTALRTIDYGADEWPHGLTLRLDYADGDEVTLGLSGVRGADDDAPSRLVAHYPSLLRDLDHSVS